MTQESNRAASRAGWNLWQWQPPLLGWQVQQHTGDTDIHYRPQVFIVVAPFGQWGAANLPELANVPLSVITSQSLSPNKLTTKSREDCAKDILFPCSLLPAPSGVLRGQHKN